MKLLPALRGCIALTLIIAALGCERQPKHLVLITVDTLRADRIGAYGYEAAKTPVIDALASESSARIGVKLFPQHALGIDRHARGCSSSASSISLCHDHRRHTKHYPDGDQQQDGP